MVNNTIIPLTINIFITEFYVHDETFQHNMKLPFESYCNWNFTIAPLWGNKNKKKTFHLGSSYLMSASIEHMTLRIAYIYNMAPHYIVSLHEQTRLYLVTALKINIRTTAVLGLWWCHVTALSVFDFLRIEHNSPHQSFKQFLICLTSSSVKHSNI